MRTSKFVGSMVSVVILAPILSGCLFRPTLGQREASQALQCPVSELHTFVPHQYNLGAGQRVFRGCGGDAILQCMWSTAADICYVVYVSSDAAPGSRLR